MRNSKFAIIMMMVKRIIHQLIAIFFIGGCFAQSAKFNNIWVDKGLIHQTIWDIKQDKEGLLWFATTNGLTAYDGYGFTKFSHQNAYKNTIINEHIRAIEVDDSGNVWIGSSNGIGQYVKSTGAFVQYLWSDLGLDVSVTMQVYSLLSVEDESLYVGTSHGLFQFDKKDLKLTSIPINKSQQKQPLKINDLLLFGEKQLIIATEKGVFSLEPSTLVIENIPLEINSNVNSRILQVINGTLYLGTNKGMFAFDEQVGQFKKIFSGLDNLFILSLAADQLGNVWVGTFREGLFKIDQKKNITQYQQDVTDEYALKGRNALSLLVDHSGNLWIGTFNNGLNTIDPLSLAFKRFNQSKSSLACLKSSVIYAVVAIDEQRMWLGTQNGLALYNEQTNGCRLIDEIVGTGFNRAGLNDSEVLSLMMDKADRLWIGTLKGLNRYSIHSNEMESLGNQLPAKSIYAIVENNNGDVVVGTILGAYINKAGSSQFKQIAFKDTTISSVRVNYIQNDRNNRLIFGTESGLFFLNENEQLQRVSLNVENIASSNIRALLIDNENNLWVGINNKGLYRFNSKGILTNSFKNERQLKAINGFASMLQSDDGSVWVAGVTTGLSRINLKNNAIHHFNHSDGLQSDVFTFRAMYKDRGNQLYFGGRKGLTVFKNSDIKLNNVEPKLKITQFLYFNQPINTNYTNHDVKFINNIVQDKSIELTHHDTVFGFEFAALHFTDSLSNRYAYKMEGLDQQWNNTSSDYRRITYNSLPPGHYTFKLRASNKRGVWSATPLSIAINVLPPWWQTRIAYIVYLITLLIAVYLFVFFRTRVLHKKAKVLEKAVIDRTKELATQKSIVEKLLLRKNNEFINISHEFRTPITLILGPVQRLLRNESFMQNPALKMIQSNAERLLRLVDELLEIEKLKVSKALPKQIVRLNPVLEALAQSYKDAAVAHSLTFSYFIDKDIVANVIPDSVEKIVSNLLSNAIKYSKPDGSIEFSAFKKNKTLILKVMDTGIGLSKDEQNRVFDKFERGEASPLSIIGSGVGLSVVKELVTIQGGDIHLKSKKDSGSEFMIEIPCLIESGLTSEFNDVSENDLFNDTNTDHDSAGLATQKTELLNEKRSIQNYATRIAQEENLLEENSPKELECHSERSNKWLSIDDSSPVVLVIEDDPEMQQYIKDIMGDHYQCLVAQNGEEGLEAAKATIPDIIICDIMMPGISGHKVCERLKETECTSHIPIVMLTARVDKDSRIESWKLLADEYMTKPFDDEELLIRLDNLLTVRANLQSYYARLMLVEATEKKFSALNATESHPFQLEKQEENLQANSELVFVSKLNSVIKECHIEEAFSIEQLSERLYLSERQLRRKVKALLGVTPKEYLRKYRMEKASRLLKSGIKPSVVIYEIGYSSHSYFSREFKKYTGRSPSDVFNEEQNDKS